MTVPSTNSIFMQQCITIRKELASHHNAWYFHEVRTQRQLLMQREESLSSIDSVHFHTQRPKVSQSKNSKLTFESQTTKQHLTPAKIEIKKSNLDECPQLTLSVGSHQFAKRPLIQQILKSLNLSFRTWRKSLVHHLSVSISWPRIWAQCEDWSNLSKANIVTACTASRWNNFSFLSNKRRRTSWVLLTKQCSIQKGKVLQRIRPVIQTWYRRRQAIESKNWIHPWILTNWPRQISSPKMLSSKRL